MAKVWDVPHLAAGADKPVLDPDTVIILEKQQDVYLSVCQSVRLFSFTVKSIIGFPSEIEKKYNPLNFYFHYLLKTKIETRVAMLYKLYLTVTVIIMQNLKSR